MELTNWLIRADGQAKWGTHPTSEGDRMVEIYEVVKGLIGPVGETQEDGCFENLKVLIDLVDSLTEDIMDVARFNKNQKAGDCAHTFLVELATWLKDNGIEMEAIKDSN